jgi:guanylate kinase
VISGPSGVGKTTVIERLIAADPLLCASISATTRPPRPGEVSGRDYFFVVRDVFEQMKARELVEWADVHGELYGTPRRFVDQALDGGRDVILNVDIQGGDSVKRAFPGAVTVFIFPPSHEILEQRMRQRGEVSESDLETRLRNAKKEISGSVNYDYVVVNDDLERTVAAVQAIITAERCRRDRQKPGSEHAR